MSELNSSETLLRMALKWALQEGVSASTTELGRFSDTGCGCCSGRASPPEELRAVLIEIQREIIDGK